MYSEILTDVGSERHFKSLKYYEYITMTLKARSFNIEDVEIMQNNFN